ncbi:MAG: carboxypeptidase-like regulatory domain-containing protein [Bacteroidia bacterium]
MSFNTYFKSFVAFAVCALCAGAVWAQTTVSGTVTGDGEPLEGVTVIVQGTNIGTFSDASGKYSVSADSKIETLLFRYVGYQDQEIAVNGRSTIDVNMEGDLSIDEVVVTGYGTAKSKEITSSITSVKVDDFNQGNVNDPSQLIQGKVPGLIVSRPGGNPNGDFTLRLWSLNHWSERRATRYY